MTGSSNDTSRSSDVLQTLCDETPMRIGILKTDSVREEFQHEFGDYPAMFRAVLMASADDVPIEFRDYDVQRGEYPASIDECDAYLITGSRESVYDDQPWIHRLAQFVQELDAARHTLVGICFGHQLIAHVLGGETRAAETGWAVGVQDTQVLSPAEWMLPYRERFGLLSSHKDQVVRLPERAEVFACHAVLSEQRLHDRRPHPDLPGSPGVLERLLARADRVAPGAAG